MERQAWLPAHQGLRKEVIQNKDLFAHRTIYELYMNYIWTIYELYMNYIYLYMNYIWTIYELYMNYIWTIYELYMNYIWTIYELYMNLYGSILCSILSCHGHGHGSHGSHGSVHCEDGSARCRFSDQSGKFLGSPFRCRMVQNGALKHFETIKFWAFWVLKRLSGSWFLNASNILTHSN